MNPRPTILAPEALAEALADLDGWEHRGGALVRSYRFGDFAAATAFLAGISVAAAELDHHPDWSGVHARVDLALSTHDQGGVTRLDVELAQRAHRLALALGAG
ncbi:MAG: 4a-hydroxytetrahydrobiopterin dehydratase [Planctomycetota bacterium]